MLNKVMLIGRLGADPEVRYLPSGSAVATIRLATSRRWKDKQTGERKEETEWHRVVFFNRLAEIAGEYLKKGSQAYVEGRIRTQKWQGQDGQDRYSTEIVADSMNMLDSRSGSGGTAEFGGDQSQGGYSAPSSSSGPSNQPKQAAPKNDSGSSMPSAPPHYDDFDDDIPF
ncbi:MAG: single-stranded DNA-binding protein [Methylobacter sp.]|nr:single-stranded DNA-binding protein [Methylobacter sp.]